MSPNQHTVAPAELPAITQELRDEGWRYVDHTLDFNKSLAEHFRGQDVFVEGRVYRVNRVEFHSENATLTFYFSDGRSGARRRTVHLNDLIVAE